MTEASQPVAGSLTAVVLRACQQRDCPYFQRTDCPDHGKAENLGVVASFEQKPAEVKRGIPGT